MIAPDIHVVHLVRRLNGIEPFQTFLDSYARESAGIEHRLVIVYKGFETPAQTAPYEALAAGFAHESLPVSDEGFDVGAYRKAARAFPCRALCFLNSFSVILGGDWLRKMAACLGRDRVGIVGATGSWESASTNLRNVFRADRLRRTPLGLWRFLRRRAALRASARQFAPFPNYHLRTNAFLIERELFLRLDLPEVRGKEEAHRFESGRNGLTSRVREAGLEPCIVDRSGRMWAKEDWPASHTFRAGEQENLLVADNRTRDYAQADTPLRRLLSHHSWGSEEFA